MNKQNHEIEVVIEIPADSSIKYEYDRSIGRIVVDRVLRDGFRYPGNYGFIPNTLDWDGDELDVLVYSEEKFTPGCTLKARLVGAMKMIDDGETDTKLIAVHADDYRLDGIKNIHDVPSDWLSNVKDFFSTYKNWKRKGITSVGEKFEDLHWAEGEIKECAELYKNYRTLPKEQFITKMKTKHPEKYEY